MPSAQAAPAPDGTTASCLERVGRVAGAFARRRAGQILACRMADACDPATLERRLDRLSKHQLHRLEEACSGASSDAMGMAETCPDPTGRCMGALDSPEAVAECVMCLVAGSLDPLLQRLHGREPAETEACGGCTGQECREGSFCEPPPGLCNAGPEVGRCVAASEACPEIYQPVCGCDGTTYGNDCERRAARVGKQHDGPCRRICGSLLGAPSCGEDQFCELPPGTCERPETIGQCAERPEVCTDEYRPVCGCDGTTYSNDCDRRAAGVSLAHRGECKEFCVPSDAAMPAIDNIDECGAGRFCELPPGHCEDPQPQGQCVEGGSDTACPAILVYDPVCGCDGKTYSSDCERRIAGVSLDHRGECRNVCGGFAGVPCDDGEYCELPPNTCAWADHQGQCEPLPQGCPDHVDPVCGCDGVTYSNDCDRRMATVALKHRGACVAACHLGGDDCPEGQVCRTRYGACGEDAVGVCVALPDVCALVDLAVPLPVCGCDQVTYGDYCQAQQAGVGVAFLGPCETAGDR